MKRQILKDLHSYRLNLKKVIGKKVLLCGEYNLLIGDRRSEMEGILYGTLNDFCPQSITIGSFIDYQARVDLTDHEKAIGFLEALSAIRSRNNVRVELTDRLQAYVIENLTETKG